MKDRSSQKIVAAKKASGSQSIAGKSHAPQRRTNACLFEALEARELLSGTPVAPTFLTATPAATTIVQLAWTDNDANANGYLVLRSTDGVTFSQISKLTSGTTNTFTDTTAQSGHTYYYEIQAYEGTTNSAVSNKASATTSLVAPASLTVSHSAQANTLNWTDADSSATGYYVLRSTDNVHFTLLTTLSSGTTHTYADTTITNGTPCFYKVEAFNAVATSAASASMGEVKSSSNISITTEFGHELVITATGANDSISISESGSTFTITADGATYHDAAMTAGLFIYTRGGVDSISIASSVTSNTTIETIDGAATTITSAGTDVTSWIDSTDTYTGTGTIHRVGTFAGGVSKAIGQALANPTDAGSTVTVSASLFGTGPIVADANQGESGDCYLLSSLAAFAAQNPNLLMQSAVDMGDGTYVVQFLTGNQPTFVRVSNQFSTGPLDGFMWAVPGADGSIWAMVMEKAFADFRTGANTYASIASGWMGEVYSDFGINSTSFLTNAYSQTTLYNMFATDLANGEEVTFGTSQTPPNLVGDHAYTLMSVSTDSGGVTHYVVRNPWGISGDALENSQGYATLTYAQLVANCTECCA